MEQRQGMFKVPGSVKLNLLGSMPDGLSAKDVILNLLRITGPTRSWATA